MNRSVLTVGMLITAAIVALFAFSFGRDPQHINSPLVGRIAPRFALRAVGTGDIVDIEQLRGKPVILNFWATWCMPCHAEHPVLVEAARALGGDVQFVGVVFGDTEANIQSFLRERGEAYPTLLWRRRRTGDVLHRSQRKDRREIRRPDVG
jgi:cytochrome c biogenesis protein CcmG/thiol:disulfide interchange protein DsbE